MARQPDDGLWAAGLARRAKSGSAEPLCVECRDDPVERPTASELTRLWRRGKGFRRHRVYR
ncbi:MAG: hypothetical protein QOG90_389 [Actinomycetota bacterium]|jgi:hypothetical protein